MTATLTEVLALLAKATPGEWAIEGTLKGDEYENASMGSLSGCGCCGSPAISVADARAIAAAVNFLRSHGEALLAVESERDALRAALKNVMGWIDNWSPTFADDPEWPADEASARAALTSALAEKMGGGREG